MKHFCVITNRPKDPELKTTSYIKNYLETHGRSCLVQFTEGTDDHYTDAAEIPDDTDCILVLGGDGTMLQAARDIVEKDIPLLGVNLGSLGYLTEIEQTGLEQILPRLLEGEFEIEHRMMVEGRMLRNGKIVDAAYALNDIVVTRSGSFQIIHYHIWVNGQLLNSYNADGIIISTPTGSTGYNLSAGGPIVEPGAKLLLMTPICPHTLNTRSIVLSPEDTIEIEIAAGKDGRRQQVEANFDGSHPIVLYTGDRMEVRRSEKETRILKLSSVSFLETLHKKMSG
ncbi:MAG: NAD(+)/NADH kinase [Lachnospiraceae bacterium]|nr:NAD(+)/NADH kinase [Lachnospiraceae bacterium]